MEQSNVVFTPEDDFGIITVLDRVPGCVRCPVTHDVLCDGPSPRGLEWGAPMEGDFLSYRKDSLPERVVFFTAVNYRSS